MKRSSNHYITIKLRPETHKKLVSSLAYGRKVHGQMLSLAAWTEKVITAGIKTVKSNRD